MKFKDKDGIVFANIKDVFNNYCSQFARCNLCPKPLPSKYCYQVCADNPAEAARLMGYEVVEDVSDTVVIAENATTKAKSRVCEVLGIELNEPFVVRGYPNCNHSPMVYDGQSLRRYSRVGNKRHKIGSNTLLWMIEHPESIERYEGETPDKVNCTKQEEIMNDKPIRDWTLGERAKDEAHVEATRFAWTVLFSVLLDKERFPRDDLRRIWDEVEELCESIEKGYCSVSDLRDVLRREADVNIT